MDELRKAAILLKHLAPGEREQVLGRLGLEQRERLERMIAAAADVSHSELTDIVSEYQSWLQRAPATSNEPASPSDPVESKESAIADAEVPRPSISCNAGLLSERLAEEPAPVLSAVLCQVPESTARELYHSLPEDRQAAVAARLPAQRELKPLVQQELARFLSAPAAGLEGATNPGKELLVRLVGS